jgi:hypothetical protein
VLETLVVYAVVLQFLTVKFMGTRKEDAERMGVLCVQVCGYHHSRTALRGQNFLRQLVSRES